MPPQDPPKRRRRGVILTPIGLQKLSEARTDIELQENAGHRYTLEDLSERTGLAVDTLAKVFAAETGVDKQTLKVCFRAFGLALSPEDFGFPDENKPSGAAGPPALEPETPELPEGQVPLNSRFYVERPPVEPDSYRTVLQPGSLIRIKGSRRTGKSSLLVRILDQAQQHGCETVQLSFQLADRSVFQDLQRLLQWFCASVGLALQMPNRLSDYWDDLFGSQISCKMYFEQYLLSQIPQSLVLGLDDVDRLFEYPNVAGDFFSLLRVWHEDGKNREIWRKLHLVVVHSTDVYIPLDANKSPFNVGLPIELANFSSEQVGQLANRYSLNGSPEATAQLMQWVGGQPYLVRKGLYFLARQEGTLADLCQISAQTPYADHLQRQLWHLQRQPQLAQVYAQILASEATGSFQFNDLMQLQSMGFISMEDNRPVPSCELYRQFFTTQLGAASGPQL